MPVVMQDVLVSSYQTGSHASAPPEKIHIESFSWGNSQQGSQASAPPEKFHIESFSWGNSQQGSQASDSDVRLPTVRDLAAGPADTEAAAGGHEKWIDLESTFKGMRHPNGGTAASDPFGVDDLGDAAFALDDAADGDLPFGGVVTMWPDPASDLVF